MERAVTSELPADPRGACDRREEILDAATRLFAEHGFSDAVTQLLADELRVGKGTIYRHFPSKRALFLAAADRVMERLNERVDEGLRDVADPLERVERGIRAYLAFFDEHPAYVELLIQERAGFKDRKRPTYFEHRDRRIARWRETYRDLIAAGRVRDMPAERITDVISSALYGAIFLNYFSGRDERFSARADDILDVVFTGILSDAERQTRARRRGGRARSARGGADRAGGE